MAAWGGRRQHELAREPADLVLERQHGEPLSTITFVETLQLMFLLAQLVGLVGQGLFDLPAW